MFIRKAGSFLLLLAIILSLGVPTTEAAPLPFPDMNYTWFRYREAVDYLVKKDVISGYPDGTFKPKQTINRAELLKLVFKGKSDVDPVGRRCFSDVNPDAWYAAFVCAAERRGVVTGYSDGTFKPEQTVNFAEAIKMVLLSYGRTIEEGRGDKWYEPYVKELDKNDILSRGSYVPWTDLNRERAADLIARLVRFDEDRKIPRLSEGCGKAQPVPPPGAVEVNGLSRQFLLTVPSGYVTHDPAPLIVAFHGRTNSNEMIRSYMRLDRNLTDAIIAYPAAISNGNGSFSWADPGNKPNEIRDIAFFDNLVESLGNAYCIDMDQIYVVGHSLGAWMANTVACVRGDVVHGSATVGGDGVATKCAGPAAALISHNPHDNLASFGSTERARDQRLTANGCSNQAKVADPGQLNCVSYNGCEDHPVLWCPHTIDTDERGTYYPHNWPREMATYIKGFFDDL